MFNCMMKNNVWIIFVLSQEYWIAIIKKSAMIISHIMTNPTQICVLQFHMIAAIGIKQCCHISLIKGCISKTLLWTSTPIMVTTSTTGLFNAGFQTPYYSDNCWWIISTVSYEIDWCHLWNRCVLDRESWHDWWHSKILNRWHYCIMSFWLKQNFEG